MKCRDVLAHHRDCRVFIRNDIALDEGGARHMLYKWTLRTAAGPVAAGTSAMIFRGS